MGLTDIPFDHKTNIEKRYSLLRPDSSGDTDMLLKSMDYTQFLQEEERKAQNKTPTKLTMSCVKPMVSFQLNDKLDVISLQNIMAKSQKEHGTTMKHIEDRLWRQKQTERELKRVEGDVIKNKQVLKKVIKECEHSIGKKQLAEDKKLNQSLERYTELQKDNLRQKKKIVWNRIHDNVIDGYVTRDADAKVQRQSNSCMQQFRTKMAELQMHRAQVARLSADFGQKIKHHEEAEHVLKKEIAELVLQMNMATLAEKQDTVARQHVKKLKTQSQITEDFERQQKLERELNNGDNDIKATDMNKQKLYSNFKRAKAHLEIKKRDEQRHLIDTQKRLLDNSLAQRSLGEVAKDSEFDCKARDADMNIKAHQLRKQMQQYAASKTKKENAEKRMLDMESIYKKQVLEEKSRVYNDNVKHFQKFVQRNDNVEQALHKQVRSAEYDCHQQEQTVNQLVAQLADMKRKNANSLQQISHSINHEEDLLAQKIQKEQSRLDKALCDRDEAHVKIQQHRQITQNDRFLLDKYEKENKRSQRIAAV